MSATALKKPLTAVLATAVLSTVVWGVLILEDILAMRSTWSARTFFGRTAAASVPPALWFAPLNNPMKLLIYSMAFGLVHLFVGLGIKGYMQIKDKQYLDFFCDVVLWYVFLIGLILMLIPSDIFASDRTGEDRIPTDPEHGGKGAGHHRRCRTFADVRP